MDSDLIVVVTSCPSQDLAEKILRRCLEARLVACGQISAPVKSQYWWKDQIESAEEFILSLKTRRELFSQVSEKIQETHTYEVPEILSFSVDKALPSYLNWVSQETP